MCESCLPVPCSPPVQGPGIVLALQQPLSPSAWWSGGSPRAKGPGFSGKPRHQSLSFSWTSVHCHHNQPQLLKGIR